MQNPFNDYHFELFTGLKTISIDQMHSHNFITYLNEGLRIQVSQFCANRITTPVYVYFNRAMNGDKNKTERVTTL